jgi:predicted ATPase/DNA-binding winged helix-turn-helix (wHTH) protein
VQPVFRFSHFEVRPSQRSLRVDGRPVSIGSRAFDVLVSLIQRQGQLVTKLDLLNEVWQGRIVEEANVTVQVSALRKVLGPDVITTIPGRGYCFAANPDAAPQQPRNAAPALSDEADPLPAAAATLPLRTNLPERLSPLYGRAADVQALRAKLQTHRLVTLVGAGGVGKSRLAQATAHDALAQWRDGAWMVELASLTDPLLITTAVAQSLGIPLQAAGDALCDLLRQLAPRRLLLVLDNCEHLLEASGALAHALCTQTSGITVLATSQQPLRVPQEQPYRLAPLAVPSSAACAGLGDFGALQLLSARIQSIDPGFRIDDRNLACAIDMCRRLDGMPLAIELAAARVSVLGLQGVLQRLDERFRLLKASARPVLRRHQALLATLEWSHTLLAVEQQAVFRRLGVFVGTFTMHMAQAVARDEGLDQWAVIDALCALVDKSLVTTLGDDEPRYRLLESMRAFAHEKLVRSGELDQVAERHAVAVHTLLSIADEALLDEDITTDQYASRLEHDLDNIRAAHAWARDTRGQTELAIGVAARASPLTTLEAEASLWLASHQQQVAAGISDAVAARYWFAIFGSTVRSRFSRALLKEAACKAEALYRMLGVEKRVYLSLHWQATSDYFDGRTEGLRQRTEQMCGLIKPEWPTAFRARQIKLESMVARLDGRLDIALERCRQHIALVCQGAGWERELAARAWLVDLLWESGDLAEAAREIDRLALQIHDRPVSAFWTTVVYNNQIGILCESGLWERASAAARTGLPSMRASGLYGWETLTHLFWCRGQIDLAATLLAVAQAHCAAGMSLTEVNESRLLSQARKAIEAVRGRPTIAEALPERSLPSRDELHARMVDALK